MSPGRGTVARGSVSRVWLEFTIVYSTLGINLAKCPHFTPLPARFSTAPERARPRSTTHKHNHAEKEQPRGWREE